MMIAASSMVEEESQETNGEMILMNAMAMR